MASIVTSRDKPDEVLVLYTGGTIGSAPRDKNDPGSPQIVVPWTELEEATPDLKRLPFGILPISMDEPLDSCNVRHIHWQWMAKEIERHYSKVNGVVILHGTDTMVYTASALSFMLRDLGKPVVITGSQRSAMVDVRNDAVQNMITAIQMANPSRYGLPVIPEVIICFGGLICRGNRGFKDDTTSFRAYDSKNYPFLGTAGNNIAIDERLILPKPVSGRVFRTVSRMSPNVATIWMSPGIQDTDIVERQLSIPSLKAAIVAAYGSGDIPTDDTFLNYFRAAHERGIVLVAVTQCPRGPVELGIYETSAKLIEVGFISAYDITLAAAQTKLMSILADDPDDKQTEIEDKFMRALAGEQSRSTFLTRFRGRDDGGAERLTLTDGASNARKRLRAGALVVEGPLSRIETAKLRLRGAQLIKTAENTSTAEIKVYMNLDPDEQPTVDDKRMAGTFDKWPSKDGVVIFDVTRVVREMGEPGRPVSFTFSLETDGFLLEWHHADLAVVVNELR